MKSVYIFRSYGPYDDPVGSKHVDTFHNKLVCLTENLFYYFIFIILINSLGYFLIGMLCIQKFYILPQNNNLLSFYWSVSLFTYVCP